MTGDGKPGSKKIWTKPKLRKLNVSEQEIARLFGDYSASSSPRRQARA